MTYDYSNPSRPGPSSPQFWSVTTIVNILGNGEKVNPSKLLVGINFYGNDFKVSHGGGAIINHQYLKLLKDTSPKLKWDNTHKEHYFYYNNGTESHVVYYPTPLYVSSRLDSYKSYGCGVSIWEIGQGLDYFFNYL